MTKVFDWIASHATRRPQSLALIDFATGRQQTYLEMHQSVARYAGAMVEAGVVEGDRVAVLSANSTAMFEIEFACARIGAVFCPLNIRLTEPEIDFIIGDLKPSLVLHDQDRADVATTLATKHRSQRAELSLTGDETSWSQACAKAEPIYDMLEQDADNDWLIIYTSGTTGHPKGARLTHAAVQAHAVNAASPSRLTQDSTNIAFLPLFHTGGLNVFANPTFHVGGTVLVMPEFDPANVLGAISNSDYGVTHFIGVPTTYQFMAEHPAFDSADFSRVECAIVGGAPAPKSLIERFQQAGLTLAQCYGMTETGPAVLMLDHKDALTKNGSSGKPVLHVDVRLVSDEGKDVDAGETGEIWVRGPSITPGYWQRPEANAKDFADGWLKTGDAAMCDEEGYYYIVDRWKDMYISGGENVYPSEIENVIARLEPVFQVAVIGVPDEKWGEVGCAFIVPKEGATIVDEDIIAACNEQLARYKIPRHVRTLAEFPVNATGKILKRDLRGLF